MTATNAMGFFKDKDVGSAIGVCWFGDVSLDIVGDRLPTGIPYVGTDWIHMAFTWRSSDGLGRIFLNGALAKEGNLNPVRNSRLLPRTPSENTHIMVD